MKRVQTTIKFQLSAASAAFALIVGAGACGKQSFSVTESKSEQSAPGNYFAPPKVDILLVQDDTGSMSAVHEQIAQQMPEFLNHLTSTGWDFHFTTAKLTHDTSVTQIAGSRFDSNWGTEWIPPYPGAKHDAPGTISSLLFKKPSQFGAFLASTDISSGANGEEKGLEKIHDFLKNRTKDTTFLRDDATLVVLMVGNGNDTSGVKFCPRSGDGLMVPCSDGSSESSLKKFEEDFKALKAPGQFKFYAAVAAHTQCLGANAFVGTRYVALAKATGGQNYDICSVTVSSVLDNLGASMKQSRGLFRTRYVFIEKDAERSSIEVIKYIGGDPKQTAAIHEDPNNGWTYAGKVENVYTISEPAPMNLASGYAIELHGTAMLQGEDTAGVIYKPAGAKDSVTK